MTLPPLTAAPLADLLAATRYDTLIECRAEIVTETIDGQAHPAWYCQQGSRLADATPYDLERAAAEDWHGLSLAVTAPPVDAS